MADDIPDEWVKFARDRTASATLDDIHRCITAVYPLVAARTRADTANQIADAITAKRNEHWQQTKANNVRTPNDYGEHDAYYKATEIARGFGGSP